MSDSTPNPPQMKRCTKCGEEKPLEMFGPSKAYKDGISGKCKACRIAYDESRRRLRGMPIRTTDNIAKDGYKRCSICKELKPVEAFHRNKSRRDGLHSDCRTCFQSPEARAKAQDKLTIPEGFKRCTRCLKVNPLEAFGIKESVPGGRRAECKACRQAAGSKQYEIDMSYWPDGRKRCTKCEQKKPLEAFTRDKTRKGGFRDRCKECDHAYNKTNTATKHEYNRAYYGADIEGQRTRTRLFRALHPERYRVYGHNRRARLARIGGKFTSKDIAHMMSIQQGHCCYCGRLGHILTIEHIIPITREGSSNDPWNLCLACPRCNSSKKDKLLEEWTDRWYLR